jgi:hypothetical protein
MDSNLECPACHVKFEHISMIRIDGMLMLRVGSFVIREAQGICLDCGRVIYWSVSNKIISQVIKSALLKEI